MSSYLTGPLEDDEDWCNNELEPSSGDVIAVVTDAEIAAAEAHVASIKGKATEFQKRFDMDKLRPGEIWFADAKPYPVPVRGGTMHAFIAIDVKTARELKVGIRSKTAIGLATRQTIVHWGLHKMPYKCTLYTDGCGAMVHAETAAYALGVDYAPIPVDCQRFHGHSRRRWCTCLADVAGGDGLQLCGCQRVDHTTTVIMTETR